ncbi:antibiotic biosynthesis monooxygenase [Pontibacter brevis]
MQHLKKDLFPKLSTLAGFRGASVYRNDMEQAVEFLVVTNWESMEAIRRFAGNTPDLAVVPEEVQRMTLSFDKKVRHYNVVLAFPES